MGRHTALATRGRKTQPLAMYHAKALAWTGAGYDPALRSIYEGLSSEAPPASGTPPLSSHLGFVRRIANDALVLSRQVGTAPEESLTPFPAGPLAEQLKGVAALIRTGLPTRVYYARLGGFDTHAGQLLRHERCLQDFATAVKAFYRELDAMGQAERVLTLAFSEFGRRVDENGSKGTDHGSAGPVFLLGPMVSPGLHGVQPSLRPEHLADGDPVHAVDFRSVYAAVLQGWLGVSASDVLGQHVEPIRVLQTQV